MVGAENIYHQIISAVEFSYVVGYVWQPVRRLSRGLYYHFVLFVAELC